jgi:hypothetical protein
MWHECRGVFIVVSMRIVGIAFKRGDGRRGGTLHPSHNVPMRETLRAGTMGQRGAGGTQRRRACPEVGYQRGHERDIPYQCTAHHGLSFPCNSMIRQRACSSVGYSREVRKRISRCSGPRSAPSAAHRQSARRADRAVARVAYTVKAPDWLVGDGAARLQGRGDARRARVESRGD